MKSTPENSLSRRKFLQRGSAAAIGSFSIVQAGTALRARANSMIQMAIIGTGGRGRYDGRNLMKTGKVKMVALADYFDFQMEKPGRDFDVPQSHRFDGLDGYKKVMDLDEVDAVLLTTAPYFRPFQFEAAISAGKHAFVEKPIAIDSWGCHKFLTAGKKAKEKNLTVGAGLQSRYEPVLQKTARAVRDGMIGKPFIGHSTRMGGDLWRRERPDHFTERDHQIRHWLYFLWASGDFIVEQHIHNIDIFNWFTGMLPDSAYGQGGRDVRLDVGDIYDHIQVLYQYPNDMHLTHTGTQIEHGTRGSEKHIIGTQGTYDENKGLMVGKDQKIAANTERRRATEIEMEQFAASVLGEHPTINNSDYVTTSTFTCILGRTAAYEGRKVTWDELWDSKKRIEMPV